MTAVLFSSSFCVCVFIGQVILAICCLSLHYLISINSEHEVIKASSPLFCHIIMSGGDMVVLMCGLATISTDMMCRIVPSITAIAFSTMFGALLAKTFVCRFLSFCLLSVACFTSFKPFNALTHTCDLQLF
jgi:hypothetical protein